MKVIRLTKDIKQQIGYLLLGIPMFILNLWVVQRSNNIKLELTDFTKGKLLIFLSIFALWTIVNVIALLKARWFSFYSTFALVMSVIVVNVNIVLLRKTYALAFYVLFILIVSSLYLISNWKTLKMPFYNSNRRWFEGLPKFYSGILTEASDGMNTYKVQISNLNEFGCFIYLTEKVDNIKAIRMKISNYTYETETVCVTKSDNENGKGLLFSIGNSDRVKEISEFIDRARSYGYVET